MGFVYHAGFRRSTEKILSVAVQTTQALLVDGRAGDVVEGDGSTAEGEQVGLSMQIRTTVACSRAFKDMQATSITQFASAGLQEQSNPPQSWTAGSEYIAYYIFMNTLGVITMLTSGPVTARCNER